MSTPYDTDEELLTDESLHIRARNDEFRTELVSVDAALARNRLVFTSGVAGEGEEFTERALTAVREFEAFDDDNDPFGEHSCGSFELDGVTLEWKIDLYDRLLDGPARNPADDALTRRVLTVMRAEEY